MFIESLFYMKLEHGPIFRASSQKCDQVFDKLSRFFIVNWNGNLTKNKLFK